MSATIREVDASAAEWSNPLKCMGIAHLWNMDALPVFHLGRVPAASDDVSETTGKREGREVCVIAHRFGYALVHGAAALNSVPVLGHGCHNPLCQRIGPGHVKASSHTENRRAYLARRPWLAARWRTRLP